ncbi:MAG TPA: cupredoxin domain-containing protein [Acidimicrobiales bacterium]|nr:cupredoxin domain-containing protein [Acidimicrobiales bacterium]
MLTQSSKVFLPLSAVALVFAVGYMVLTGNRDGFLLFLALTVVAGCAGIAVARVRENEFPPAVPPDAPPPEYRDVAPGQPLVGGLWAATGALALTLLLTGFVLGPLATAGGLVVAVATVVGWMTTVSSEHTGRRIDLAPLGLPVLGLFTIFALMFFISRVLLAVPEQASTAIALAVAVVILGGAAVVALRPSVSSRTLAWVLAVSGVLLTAGGIVAAAAGQREVHRPPGVSAGPVSIEAVNNQFDLQEFELQADVPAEIRFHNEDENVPHNVAIYGDDKYTQEIFVGDILAGPVTIDYRFEAPHPGEYFFRCDVHPNMAGKVKVVPAEGEQEGGH